MAALTVEDLIAQLRANNGFVMREQKGDNALLVQHAALLPAQRKISPFMFQALLRLDVLRLVAETKKAGITTQTYRIV
jgi:hypothetical protein